MSFIVEHHHQCLAMIDELALPEQQKLRRGANITYTPGCSKIGVGPDGNAGPPKNMKIQENLRNTLRTISNPCHGYHGPCPSATTIIATR